MAVPMALGSPGPVHDPGLQDDQGQAGLGHGPGHLVVGHPLGSFVFAQPGPPVAQSFVDEPSAGIGGDGDGAGVDDPGNAQLPGCFQDVAGALHVDPVGLPPVFDSDSVPGGQVEEAVKPAHGNPQGGFVPNVSLMEDGAVGLEVPGGPGVAHQCRHLVSGPEELPGQAAANESGGARHQIFHGVLPIVEKGIGCLPIIAMTGRDYLWKNGGASRKRLAGPPALTRGSVETKTADRWAS